MYKIVKQLIPCKQQAWVIQDIYTCVSSDDFVDHVHYFRVYIHCVPGVYPVRLRCMQHRLATNC
jgi:hypothetical protein